MMFAGQVLLSWSLLFFVHRSSEIVIRASQHEMVDEIRADLLSEYRSGGLSGVVYAIERRLERDHDRDEVLLLVLADRQPVTGNLVAWPTVSHDMTGWTVRDLYRKGADKPETIGMTVTNLPGGMQLLTGYVLTSSRRVSGIHREAMISAGLLAIPISLLIAFVMTKLIGSRIRVISSVTEMVRMGNLSQRVPLDGTDGLFDQLSEDINAMLDQLDALVLELQMMTDGLAHDLRSPITRLKSVIEHAIIDTKDEAALVALQKVSTEAETLLAMLTTALQISRAEAGIGKKRFVKTGISELLGDLVEIYGPLAEDHGIALISVAPNDLIVSLHRELISQALGNLIENALKYAEGATQIELRAEPLSDGVRLTVADNGKGIPADRRADAQKRFGRLDSARQTPGSGLGLSLVEAVAKLHGGVVSLSDNQPGLRVELRLEP